MTGAEQVIRRKLGTLWWIAFPPFLVIVLWVSYERACHNAYELLQPVMQRQDSALVIAAIYVTGYAWCIAAGVLTARAWGPGAVSGRLQAIWGRERFKLLAMAGAMALEMVPHAVWVWFGRTAVVC